MICPKTSLRWQGICANVQFLFAHLACGLCRNETRPTLCILRKPKQNKNKQCSSDIAQRVRDTLPFLAASSGPLHFTWHEAHTGRSTTLATLSGTEKYETMQKADMATKIRAHETRSEPQAKKARNRITPPMTLSKKMRWLRRRGTGPHGHQTCYGQGREERHVH